MKTKFVKLMSVALLFVVAFMATGCSKDDDGAVETVSTQSAETLISTLTDAGILVDGVLANGATCAYIAVEDQDDAVDYLEDLVGVSFDASGDKVFLSDKSSYVDIKKSSIDGVYYDVMFSLGTLDDFEIVFALEEYLNDENFLF